MPPPAAAAVADWRQHYLGEWVAANPDRPRRARRRAARHIGPADPEVMAAMEDIAVNDAQEQAVEQIPVLRQILAQDQAITRQNIADAFGIPEPMLGQRIDGDEAQARADRAVELERQRVEDERIARIASIERTPYVGFDPAWSTGTGAINTYGLNTAVTNTAFNNAYEWTNAYYNNNTTTAYYNNLYYGGQWTTAATTTYATYNNVWYTPAPPKIDWCDFTVSVAVSDELRVDAYFDLEAFLLQRIEHELRRAVPMPGGAVPRYFVKERRERLAAFGLGITNYQYVLKVAMEDYMARRLPVDLTAFCDALERVVQAAEWARSDREFAVRGRLIARAEMRERKRLERERLAAAERARVEAERVRAAAAAERARLAEERRVAELERQRNKAQIEAKAMRLLEDILHPDEFAEYAAKKQVVIESKRHPGRGYIIRPLWRRIALCHRDPKGNWVEDTTQSLCIHPQDEQLPEGDTVASLVLLTRFNEAEMLRVAIKHGYAA